MGSIFSTSEPPPIPPSELLMQFFWIWVAFSTLKRFLEERDIKLGNKRNSRRNCSDPCSDPCDDTAECLSNVIGLKTVKRENSLFYGFY